MTTWLIWGLQKIPQPWKIKWGWGERGEWASSTTIMGQFFRSNFSSIFNILLIQFGERQTGVLILKKKVNKAFNFPFRLFSPVSLVLVLCAGEGKPWSLEFWQETHHQCPWTWRGWSLPHPDDSGRSITAVALPSIYKYIWFQCPLSPNLYLLNFRLFI